MLCNLLLPLPIAYYTEGVTHSVRGKELLGRPLCSPSVFLVFFKTGGINKHNGVMRYEYGQCNSLL